MKPAFYIEDTITEDDDTITIKKVIWLLWFPIVGYIVTRFR